MSDWATATVAKAECRFYLLQAYDLAVRMVLTPTEARVLVKSALEKEQNGDVMWALYEHWLNEDRPL